MKRCTNPKHEHKVLKNGQTRCVDCKRIKDLESKHRKNPNEVEKDFYHWQHYNFQ